MAGKRTDADFSVAQRACVLSGVEPLTGCQLSIYSVVTKNRQEVGRIELEKGGQATS